MIEPFNLVPLELDRLLALGWFRMQQTIFTTDVLYFNEKEYNAIWLRVDLELFEPDRKYKSLQKKNRQFEVEIKPAQITIEHEMLYQFYRQNISFECAPTLHWLLFGNSDRNIYNTYMINIYGNNELVGAGFFDFGNNSAAGIISLYDPTYKKFSLGKYIILSKMNYCKQQNFKYFYPGYFVPGYPMFDYKLGLGTFALEYFQSHEKKWFPIRYFNNNSHL